MNDNKICLIRHGKTAANEKHLYCGCTELPLSEAGVNGILELKHEGIYPACGMFFTSGMDRAVQTLRLIYGDVSHRPVSALREYHFGDFEMKSYEELKDRKDYQEWIMDQTGEIGCPGGESKNIFRERVLQAFDLIMWTVQDSGIPAAVVCHGGTIAVIMENLFPNRRTFYEWQPAAGHGYIIGSTFDTTKSL